MKISTLKLFQPVALSVLRIMTVYLFLLHGTVKFFSFPVSMGGVSEGLAPVAGILKIVGGVLLILGPSTHPSAFVLSDQMVVAHLMAYVSSDNISFPLANQGESAVLFCFVFLYLTVVGGRAWALGNVFGKDKD